MKNTITTLSVLLALTGCEKLQEATPSAEIEKAETALVSEVVEAKKSSTPKGFGDDLDAAFERAKASGKLVYACFSGSDWCGWCKKLEMEVFSDASFIDALKDKYEFVYIDSPKDKTCLSENAKAKNPELVKKFNIRGFPSMIIFKADKTILMQDSAYRNGGAKGYIEFLSGIAADPDSFLKIQSLGDEWIKPINDKYMAIFAELNQACGKYINENLQKAGNTKTREELWRESKVVVKDFIPKFAALYAEAEAKAKLAPEEIRKDMDEYVNSLKMWLENTRKEVAK